MLPFCCIGCFLYHKVTKLKANHNIAPPTIDNIIAVSYITKLLNWKQITTPDHGFCLLYCCFLYHKVTKLKANHNMNQTVVLLLDAVSYITKLLNWKQITTLFFRPTTYCRCFLYHKVTKLKANHNSWIVNISATMLFPISQSY